MTRLVIVDVEQERVIIQSGMKRKKTLRGQWFEFYTLLALNRVDKSDQDHHLQPTELCTVGMWINKTPTSAGKEVSRHIRSLELDGFAEVILYTRRTYGWHLNVKSKQIVWNPSVLQAVEWLTSQGWSNQHFSSDISQNPQIKWIKLAVKAIVTLNSGNTDEAFTLSMRAATVAADSFLKKISDLLILRSAARAGINSDMQDQIDRIVGNTDECSQGAIAKSIQYRVEAIEAFLSPYEHSQRALDTLSRLATKLNEKGDISGLGAIYNTMGVLARRAGSPERAEIFLRRAIPLLVISGDIPNLQAALFNLGHARYAMLRHKQIKPDDDIFDLIDLDCEIRRTLAIGKDSAQAEILGANLALKAGDIDRASTYLGAAEELLHRITSEFDSACFYRTRAKYKWVRATKMDAVNSKLRVAVISDLKTALKLYRKAGHAVAKVEKELARVKAGGPPFVEYFE